jgi:hypothetical protein
MRKGASADWVPSSEVTGEGLVKKREGTSVIHEDVKVSGK